MADAQHNLSEEQQDTVDHLMSLVNSMLDTGTFEDEDALLQSVSELQFTLESVISSSPDTQKPD